MKALQGRRPVLFLERGALDLLQDINFYSNPKDLRKGEGEGPKPPGKEGWVFK